MTLRLRYAARSDVGLIREGNEDSGYAGPALLVVADGMGGHAAGELASALAVATIAELDVHPPSSAEVLAALGDAVADTGDRISDVITENPDLAGMGTTMTGAFWMGDRVAIVHVGDSRAYVLRDGELLQITHDHTYVQTLVDAGRITEEEATVHPRRSLLMRALDGMNPVEADLSLRETRDGDRYMLCTDGLSGVVGPDEMAAYLAEGDPTGCVMRLVDLALERGAPDNVTVVVADVIDTPDFDVPEVAGDRTPVVVGAAGEPRVRLRLPGVPFPYDAQPDPDRPDTPPPLAGGEPTAPQPLIDADLQVPAAEAARRSARQDEERRHRRRRVRRRWGIGVAVVVVLVALGVTAGLVARSWLASQWYVSVNGSAGTGTVGVYRGVEGSLVGVRLSQLWSDSGLRVGDLPYFDQELVSKGIPAADEGDAQRIVSELQGRAAECAAVVPPAGCPGSPS